MTRQGYAKRLVQLACVLLVPAAAATAAGAPPALGDPLPGLTDLELQLFQEGKLAFSSDFTVEEGVGPLFRERACATCHDHPTTGGTVDGLHRNVIHFTITHQDTYEQVFLATEVGGPVQQQQTIAGTPGAGACMMSPEPIPALPGVFTSPRHPLPIFGMGLIDAVQDTEILRYQGRQPWKDPAVIGVANWGVEMEGLRQLLAFTFDSTRTQPAGTPRVGRFGWKAFGGTLFQFSAEAMNNDVGVTTPFLPREPTAGPLPPECRLALYQPNDHNSQKNLRVFYFKALSAPPARGPITLSVRAGEGLFRSIGCADCHRDQMKTGPDYFIALPDGSAHRVDALSNKVFDLWSDLLLHDLGPANADHRPQGKASGQFWRTTPLWGIRHKTRHLHDGRVTTLTEALAAHGGEAAPAAGRFFSLSDEDRAHVLDFLNSL